MRMGQLSLRPMERLCAIGVLKAAGAARYRSSAPLITESPKAVSLVGKVPLGAFPVARAILGQRFQFLYVIFKTGLDVVFRRPAQHLFGFLDDHGLFRRSRLLAWNDLDL